MADRRILIQPEPGSGSPAEAACGRSRRWPIGRTAQRRRASEQAVEHGHVAHSVSSLPWPHPSQCADDAMKRPTSAYKGRGCASVKPNPGRHSDVLWGVPRRVAREEHPYENAAPHRQACRHEGCVWECVWKVTFRCGLFHCVTLPGRKDKNPPISQERGGKSPCFMVEAPPRYPNLVRGTPSAILTGCARHLSRLPRVGSRAGRFFQSLETWAA